MSNFLALRAKAGVWHVLSRRMFEQGEFTARWHFAPQSLEKRTIPRIFGSFCYHKRNINILSPLDLAALGGVTYKGNARRGDIIGVVPPRGVTVSVLCHASPCCRKVSRHLFSRHASNCASFSQCHASARSAVQASLFPSDPKHSVKSGRGVLAHYLGDGPSAFRTKSLNIR